MHTRAASSSHYTHLSLEQRILAFEKECEERSRSTMEEKVCIAYNNIVFLLSTYVLFQINQFKNGELLRVRMESKENLKKELQKKRSEVRSCVLFSLAIILYLCSVGTAISGKD